MAQTPAEITLILQGVNVAYVKLEGQTSHTLRAASSKHDELPFYFGSRIVFVSSGICSDLSGKCSGQNKVNKIVEVTTQANCWLFRRNPNTPSKLHGNNYLHYGYMICTATADHKNLVSIYRE
jgi:hypothetical protein